MLWCAVKIGFEKMGHSVSYHDTAHETNIEDILDTEVCFLCVPTPTTEVCVIHQLLNL